MVLIGMTLLAFVSLVFLPAKRHDPVELAMAAVAALLLFALLSWQAAPGWLRLAKRLVPFATFGVIAILRDGAGGTASGFGPLVLFPVLWLALCEDAIWWIAGVICAALTLVLPVLVVGPPDYESADWRRALIMTTFAAVLGLAVSRWRGAHAEAVTDRLTGVPNRRLWDETFPRMVAQAKREGKPLSLAVVDFDRFKQFNDHRGHQAGDRLLQHAAAAWVAQLREGDLLARYGGEEFVIALYDCPAEEALDVLERVRSATPAGQTCSAGIATLAWDEDADELLGRADAALYEAKRDRDRTVLRR
jgi:diguanylate cyclase (GGDEF)-like protein